MKGWLFALGLGFVVTLTCRAEGAYGLYPVPGLFVVGAQDKQTRIDADFTAGVRNGEAGQDFAARIREAFPESVSAINDSNKRRTFAVSLQIARASKYIVDKPDGTLDAYLPVTASIYFTNLMTGEVLYTLTRTEISVATLVRADAAVGSSKVQALFLANFRELLSSLIIEAREKFQPRTLTATVRGNWKGLALLDGGSHDGIKRDDRLLDSSGNELNVVSAGPTYAVARVELGSFKTGSVFSKVTNQTLAEIRRPRVLPLVERKPDDMPKENLLQLFSDALGAKAAINLVPINSTFTQVLQAASATSAISQQMIYQRELPSYFIRLHVGDPVEYEVPTNLAYKTRRHFEAAAFAQLVDIKGRVLFSGMGRNHIEDEVTAGVSFNSAARREVVVKNALQDLANRFANEMKFVDAQQAVVSGGENFTIQDTQAVLTRGDSWRVYRSIGKVAGIKGDIWVPTWDFNVSDIKGDNAQGQVSLEVVAGAPLPAVGDTVFLNGVPGGSLITRKRFGSCPVQKLGTLELVDYGELASHLFATSVHASYFTSGLGEKLRKLLPPGSGFKSDIKFEEPTTDYCVEPVYRIDSIGTQCEKEVCRDAATVRLTYRIRQSSAAGEIKFRQGLEARITASGVPKSTSEAVRTQVLRSDIFDDIVKLNVQIGASLNKEQF